MWRLFASNQQGLICGLDGGLMVKHGQPTGKSMFLKVMAEMKEPTIATIPLEVLVLP